jgi:hypothetical protein
MRKRVPVKRVLGLLAFLLPAMLGVASQWWLYRTPAGPVAAGATGIGAVRETDGQKHMIELASILRVSGEDAMPILSGVTYESTATSDQYLKDDGEGIDVTVNRVRRFYPFQLLAWHEAAQDELGGVPVLVAYTPLVGTATVFDRRLEDGTVLSLQGTDVVWNGARLLKDETGSLWVPGLGTAVVGPRTGTVLKLLPSDVTTWAEWKRSRNAGNVLSRATGYIRDYTRDPHEGYAVRADVRFPLERFDPRLNAKTQVFGLSVGTQARAFAREDIERVILIQGDLGNLPYVIMYDTETETVHAFRRDVGEETLSFDIDDDLGIVDTATRSGWNTQGVATGGEQRGKTLTPLALTPAYWFFWAAAYPHTDLYVR